MSDTSYTKKEMNHSDNLHDDVSDDLNLAEAINFLVTNVKYLVGGVLLGALCAIIIAVLLPKQYEAKALIKIGQIGSENINGSPVESGLQVVDRIKSYSFQDTVLESLGVSTEDDEDKLVQQFRKNLKVKLEKSELISLSLKSLSRAEGVVIMQEVVNQLNKIHNKMLAPTASRLKLELDSINDELKLAEIESTQILKSLEMQSDKITDTKFSQTVLLNSLRISKDQEYRYFRDTKRVLEEKLSPERTFATHVLGKVEVSKKPVFPRYSIFIVAGAFLGLMLGFLYIAIKNLKLKLA